MISINIDEQCEPIEITVGGKKYKIEDISTETANKMRETASLDSGSDEAEKATIDILCSILGATEEDVKALGFRKRMMLVVQISKTLSEEIEGKNAQEAVAATQQ